MDMLHKLGNRISNAFKILFNEGPIVLFHEIVALFKNTTSPYITKLKITILKIKSNDGKTHVLSLDGYQLGVNLDDHGISTELIENRIREPISSSAYKRELQNLAKKTNQPVRVLEVGANIGYYALMPIAVLDNVEVYAVEPEPDNYSFLQDNISRNNAFDKFVTSNIGFGEKDGSAELILSTHSNIHTLQENIYNVREDNFGKLEIPIQRGEVWLNDQGLDVSDIDVLRMDVEGYEASVLNGLPNILDHIDLIHIEIHPNLMSQEHTEYVISKLEDSGLEIIVSSRRSDKIELEKFGSIQNHRWLELVASRPQS